MQKYFTILIAGILFFAFATESLARKHRGGGFKRGMGGGKHMRTGGGKQMRTGGGKQFGTPTDPYEEFERRGLFPTGLKPKFMNYF